MKQSVYRFLNLSVAGSIVIAALIFISIGSFFLETEFQHSDILKAIGLVTAGAFGIEYALRIWSANAAGSTTTRRRYIFSFGGIIDLLAFLPALLIPAADGSVILRLLRMLRLIQIMKIKPLAIGIKRTIEALHKSWNELVASLLISFLLIILGAVMIYFVEGPAQPEAFGSIPRALWWSLMTLTTVGYGDVYPITVGGKLIAAFIAVIGICAVALPAGIFAAAFHRTGIEG